jgi:hypothetical protein
VDFCHEKTRDLSTKTMESMEFTSTPAQTLVKTIQTYTDFTELLFDHRKMGTLA